jgi:hypothetical protein
MKMDDLRGVLCLVGVVSLCACGTPDDFDNPMEFRTTFVEGGTTFIVNGLEDPDVSGIDPSYPLSSAEGLSSNEGWLLDATTLKTARYMVECALPADQSITKVVDGQSVVLDGLLGLAPEWKDGECEEDCQEWVSACLLARTNVSGAAVSLWVAGEHEALGYDHPPANAVLEGGFYGNLFADPEGKYLCRASGPSTVVARLEGRTCSTGNACEFTRYSSCTNHSRCTMDGPDQDVPANCTTGSQATSAPYHTIATYVLP